MPFKSFLLLLPFFFLLLLPHAPLAASVQCWVNSLDDPPDHPTGQLAGHSFPKPTAADCLHIASVLPSSLWFDPAIQAAHQTLTFSYDRLASHRFDLPAILRHKSCEVRLRGRTREEPDRPGREFTREDMAFYFWNTFKAEIQRIVNECIMGTGTKGGMGILTEKLDELGLPEPMRGSLAIVMVYPIGSQRIPRQGMHIYNV